MEALIQEHFKIILSHRQYGTYIKWNIHRFTDLSTAKEKVMSLTSQVFKQSKDTFLYPQMKVYRQNLLYANHLPNISDISL